MVFALVLITVGAAFEPLPEGDPCDISFFQQ